MNISFANDEKWGPSLIVTVREKSYVICFCHHMPERSVKFFGLENYLCARCLGTLFGGIFGLILLIFHYYLPVIFVFPFMLPLILDGLWQALSEYESNNLKRLITGFLFGISAVFFGKYLTEFTKILFS